jgi:hypothetical protein
MALFRRKYMMDMVQEAMLSPRPPQSFYVHHDTRETRASIQRGTHFKGCKACCEACGREVCSQHCRGDFAAAKDLLFDLLKTSSNSPRVHHQIEELQKALKGKDPSLKQPHKKEYQELYERRCPSWPMGCAHAWLTGHEKNEEEELSEVSPVHLVEKPELSAMHGGRTEVFCRRWDSFDLYYLDVNSSYPASMTENIPVGEPRLFTRFGTDDHWAEICKLASGEEDEPVHPEDSRPRAGTAIYVDCEVEIPDGCEFPILGTIHDGKFIFPTGRFRGRFAWPELRHLPEIGGKVTRLFSVVQYETWPLLARMQWDLYEIRLRAKSDGNKGLDQTAKLLLNCSYGKWQQSPIRDQLVDERACDDESAMFVTPFVRGQHELGMWSGRAGQIQVFSESSFFMPQIASWITSLSRERLWLIYREVELGGGRVLYSDTDSAITDWIGKRVLEHRIHKTRLGGLKVENENFNFVALAPKEYKLEFQEGGPIVRMKGLSVMTTEKLKKKMDREVSEWEVWAVKRAQWSQWARCGHLAQEPGMNRFKEQLRQGGLLGVKGKKKERREDREEKREFEKVVEDRERSRAIRIHVKDDGHSSVLPRVE